MAKLLPPLHNPDRKAEWELLYRLFGSRALEVSPEWNQASQLRSPRKDQSKGPRRPRTDDKKLDSKK